MCLFCLNACVFGRKQTFVVKAINSVDGSAFVVASKNEKVFRKFNLIREQQAYGLQTLATIIYIVAGSVKIACEMSFVNSSVILNTGGYHHTLTDSDRHSPKEQII